MFYLIDYRKITLLLMQVMTIKLQYKIKKLISFRLIKYKINNILKLILDNYKIIGYKLLLIIYDQIIEYL